MGKRNGVKASTNTNMQKKGNGKGETSISSTKRTRGQNLTTDNKIGGGKKMKRGESSNSCMEAEVGTGQSQNQESTGGKTSILDLPPENANENGKGEPSSSSAYWTRSRKEAPYPEIGDLMLTRKRKKDEDDSSNPPGQDEVADELVTEGPINDLPPENANGEEEPSCSSLYWTRSRKEAQDPEAGDLEMSIKCKVDEDDSSNSPSQEEAADEVVTEGPISDLPPEMLMEIFKCVETRSLFICRLVSRQWMEISSGILTTRTDLIVSFPDVLSKPVSIFNYTPPGKNIRFKEFLKSIETCKNVPYARFSFQVHGSFFFCNKDWKGFLSVFSPSNPKLNQNSNQIQNPTTKIKYLKFKWNTVYYLTYLEDFTEKLRDLLVNKIPRLEELGLEFHGWRDARNIQLFPLEKNTKRTSKATKKAATKTATISVPVQLPYLKVLEITGRMFFRYHGIIMDLLNAAVNLTTIHVERPCRAGRVFKLLHSRGKLHLLKKVDIDVDEDFVSSLKNVTKHSDFPLAFKLVELKLNTFTREINPSFYADASNFLSIILESSKDTLEKLEMSPLGFLDGLQFPKFTKLRTLKALQRDNSRNELRGLLFPPGIRSESKSREIFSTVNHLRLINADWQHAFPREDSIPIFPCVQAFWFSHEELVGNVIAKLALMCPNLKHCTVKTKEGIRSRLNFSQVGRDIWTHLKQLESLEVDLEMDSPNHAFPALDSCFTGISTENCQRLSELMEAEKTKNKSKSPVKLPESEELMTLTQREHPSILDMKNLKKLTINPHSGERQYQGKRFFTTKITWISEEFAFKLMPQLEFNGRPSTSL